MLVTSTFLFSHNVFYPINEKLHETLTIKLSSANAFNLVWPKILSFGKEVNQILTRWQTSNRAIPVQKHADDKTNMAQTKELAFDWAENFVEKEEMLITSTFSLYTMFSRALYQGSSIHRTVWYRLNPVPNDKFFNWSKLKAFADDKWNMTVMMIHLFDRVEKTVGKRRKCCYQHFLLFPQCFSKP